MERLTGKQAQSIMEAVATIYEKTASDYRSQGGQVQHMGRDVKKQSPSSDSGGNAMQPASSAPSVKTPDASPTPKSDKPLATLNRAKKGDGFLGPTVSAGGYRMGIPNPVRKEEVEQVNEGEKPMGQHPGKSPDKATRDKYETQRRRNEAPTGVGVPDKSVGYGQLQQSVDLFDIVKGHLIDEGLTEEEALKKMLTLTDEERTEIIEGSCGSMKKKKKSKKGGY